MSLFDPRDIAVVMCWQLRRELRRLEVLVEALPR